MTTATASPFTVAKARAKTITVIGRRHTRFADWKVKLSAAKPHRLANGQLAHGTGSLRSPRGTVDRFPLPEKPTAENALALAEQVAHLLDV